MTSKPREIAPQKSVRRGRDQPPRGAGRQRSRRYEKLLAAEVGRHTHELRLRRVGGGSAPGPVEHEEIRIERA